MYKTITGIYEIVNKINGHRYIGSAVSIRVRWGTHLCVLRSNNHHSKYLQNAWNKYGEDNFDFNVIEICDKDSLLNREQYYMDIVKPEYNIRTEARSHRIEFTEEIRAKMRAARVKRVTRPETRIKLSILAKGRKFSDEHRAKLSIAQIGNKKSLGHIVSQESRDKSSASNKATYYRNHGTELDGKLNVVENG